MKRVRIVVLFWAVGMLVLTGGSAQAQTGLKHPTGPIVTQPVMRHRVPTIGGSRQTAQIAIDTADLTELNASERGKDAMKSLEDVRRIKAEIEPELMSRPEVVGMDIGRQRVNGEKTDVLAIRIYVRDRQDIPDDNPLPSDVQGVPVEVIERSFTLHSQD